MNPTHEKLLVAAIAGLIIAGAAAFAVGPALASGHTVDGSAQVTGVASYDVLNVRLWPAAFSQQVGALDPGVHVWIDRCIDGANGKSDWCLVQRGDTSGWVNASFLTLTYDDV